MNIEKGMDQILHAAELSATFAKFHKCHCTLWQTLAAPAVGERQTCLHPGVFPLGKGRQRSG